LLHKNSRNSNDVNFKSVFCTFSLVMFTEHFCTLRVVQERYGNCVVGPVVSEGLLTQEVTSFAATPRVSSWY